jgi:radical SAM superfamily enzyme YgiQ (UPF0313 family)
MSNSKYGKMHRVITIEKVIKEIKAMPQKMLFFFDSSLTINPVYTKSLFKEMKKLNKKFTCYGNVNVLANDEELCKLSREAGCLGWYIGFDSISQDTLNCIPKNTNKVDDFNSAVKNIQKYDMLAVGTFIVGFDTDKADIFDKTIKLAEDLNIDLPGVNILTPLPGTSVYKRLDKEGRILTKDWSKYDGFHVVFTPKQMTVEELEIGSSKIMEHFGLKTDKFSWLSNIIKYGVWSSSFSYG